MPNVLHLLPMIIALLITGVVTTAPPREWVEFLGFSQDGRLAAYRREIDVTLPDGHHDQYSLVHTVDVRSGYAVGTFKIAIHRLTPKGRPLKKKKGELGKLYPEYEKAYPSKRWLELKKRSRFDKLPLHTNEFLFQVVIDEDSRGAAEATGDGIMVSSETGNPLGFTAVAHGADGQAVEIGKFREPGAADRVLIARVQAFTAKNRQGVAAAVIFMIKNEGEIETKTQVAVNAATIKESTPATPTADTSYDPWKARTGTEAPKTDHVDVEKGQLFFESLTGSGVD